MKFINIETRGLKLRDGLYVVSVTPGVVPGTYSVFTSNEAGDFMLYSLEALSRSVALNETERDAIRNYKAHISPNSHATPVGINGYRVQVPKSYGDFLASLGTVEVFYMRYDPYLLSLWTAHRSSNALYDASENIKSINLLSKATAGA